MAWLFEHSATWRRIVATTRNSPVAMAGFTVTCFGVAYGLGKLTMAGTDREAKLEAKLRGSMTMDHKVRGDPPLRACAGHRWATRVESTTFGGGGRGNAGREIKNLGRLIH